MVNNRTGFRYVLAFLAVALASVPGRAPAGPAQDAAKLIEASGVRSGLAVHVGCGHGELTASLGTSDAFLVHGLDRDADNVRHARAHIRSKGFYGRVSVDQWMGQRLPYGDNMVNLLLMSDVGCQASREEIERTLAPRGVVVMRKQGNADLVSSLQYPQSSIGPDFVMFTKPVPSSIDDWTHWNHGPDGNRVAKDRVVGPPRRLQWVSGPLWARHHDMLPNISALVSAGGRLFYIMDESHTSIDMLPGRWSLLARDAFNGLLLWRQPIQEWGSAGWNKQRVKWEPHLGLSKFPIQINRRLVATESDVFVTLGFNAPVTVLDPRTGVIKRTLPNSAPTEEILHRNGILYLSIRETGGSGKCIAAVDAPTGRFLWTSDLYEGITTKSDELKQHTHVNLTLGDNNLFFLGTDRVISLDLKSGKRRWQFPFPSRAEKGEKYTQYYYPHIITMVYHKGVVLFAQLEEVVNLKTTFSRGTRMELTSLSAETGTVLWRRACTNWAHGSPPDLFVIDGTVWTFSEDGFTALGLDPVSGEIKTRVPVEQAMDIGHHHRCYRDRATTRYILSSRRGVEFTDLNSGNISLNHWIRGMCRVGVLPCNGLLYVPPDACGCYTKAKVSGFNALAGGSSPKYPPHPSVEETRLEHGPAWGPFENRKSEIEDSHDWRTYRHDGQRSGSTTASAPDPLAVKWKADVGSRPSAVTVAGGNVFLAAVDRHQVIALDAGTGRQLWSFTTGGRVDSPPTLYMGLALVGCRDGWVYCLRARDGALVWRFRAAPEKRRIIAFNQFESAWPVHGSVLVHEGVAYFVAGRSSFLDGGMHVFALDPLSGKVVMNRCLYSPDPETGEMRSELCVKPADRRSVTHHMPGALPDILVSNGTSVCMRHLKLDPKTLDSSDRPGEFPVHRGLAATAGLLDDSMFHRSHWGIDGALGRDTWCELLVFDDSTVYKIDAHGRHGWNQHGIHRPGSGYVVSAYDRKAKKDVWKQKVPVRVVSMVRAGDRLYLAGSPDVKDAKDPWASFLGKRGGRLLVVAADDGKKLSEYDLQAPPVWDGMAVAAGRLHISTCSGEIVCMGEE